MRRYLRERAFEIGRFVGSNAFLLVMGLAGLTSWLALAVMFARGLDVGAP